MSNVKAFILPDGMLSGDKCADERPVRVKKKTAPEYKTLFVSGPDFAIEKTTAKTKQILVCITSKGQFYVKNESAGGEVEILEKDSFTKFMAGAENDIEIVDEAGNRPFWVKRILRDSAFRAAFLSVANSQNIRQYLLADMTDMDTLNLQRHGNGSWSECLRGPVYETLVRSDFDTIKKVFNIMTEYMDRSAVKAELSSYAGVGRFLARSTDYNTNKNESACDIFLSRWGWGGVRELLRQYCLTPVSTLPDVIAARKIFRRSYHVLNRVGVWEHAETQFDLGSFAEYMFCACTEQGYANDPAGFWTSWGDYMNLQMSVYGEVRDKYSDHLASDEKIMSYRAKELSKVVDEEAFQHAVEAMTKLESHNGRYVIVAPKCNEDLIEEGRRMSHCVGSYGHHITSGHSYIFFLRRNNASQDSLATIEITLPDFAMAQFRARFNKEPLPEHQAYVDTWFAKAREKYLSESLGHEGKISA